MVTTADILSFIKKGQNIYSLLTLLNLTGHLWPQPANIKDGAAFDFVIVGGGTAGCTIAGNLAKLNVSVLLIEAGSEPPIETQLPGEFFFLKGTDYDWNFTTTYNDNKEHATYLQQGKVLGGSSQVNYMLYGVGNYKDYDEWASITNDSSWCFKNLCPLFKRSEKLIDKIILNSPDQMFHGTEGNLKIQKYHSDINDDYFASYKELGYNVVNDINRNNTLGFTNAYFTIGSGQRQSSALSFLSPEKDNPYLYVIYNTLATKILFDENKNAVGVEVLTKDKKYLTVKAKKEIIVTAGTIKTPQLLMLSGIGPKNHLEGKKIKVISNVPVGKSFQDHPTCILVYKMGDSKPVSPPNPHEFPVTVMDGYVAINKCQERADYEILSGVISDPRFFLEVCAFVFTFSNDICDNIYKALSGRQVHFVTHNLLYSKSRGEILLNSTDPEDKPIILPGYYSNEKDLEDHVKYIEHYNAVLGTKFYRSVNAEMVDPKLEACKGLKRGTNAYWKCYVRGMATTLHNYVGTCAMGSVVNSKLQVKGVKRLRVADASIMPRIVGSTVQATVMMIAQKVTDILVEHHQL